MSRKSSGVLFCIKSIDVGISFGSYSGSIITIVPSNLCRKFPSCRSRRNLHLEKICFIVSSNCLMGYLGYISIISSKVYSAMREELGSNGSCNR